MVKVKERLESLHRAVITIGNRFGVLADYAFREALKGILKKYFGAEAKRWSYYDREGVVYGYESMVDVDVVIKDREHILIEVKSRAVPGDVIELVNIGRLYEKVVGVKPRLAIVADYVSKKTFELASKYGIDIYTYLKS